jgi:hypothetical protein
MRVGIYGGGFKPFTTGHYSKLALAAEENDLVILFYAVAERKKGSEYVYDREMAEEVYNLVAPAIERELPKVKVVKGSPTPIVLTFEAIADWLGVSTTKFFNWSKLGISLKDIDHITVYGEEESLSDFTKYIGTDKQIKYFGDAIETGKLTFDPGLSDAGAPRAVGAYSRRHTDIDPAEIASRAAVRGSEVRSALMGGDPDAVDRFLPPILNPGERANLKRVLMRGVPKATNESLLRAMIRGYLVK